MTDFIIRGIGFSLNILSYIIPKFTHKKAFQIFATPRKGKITEKQEKFLTTAKQKIIHHNSTAIQTYQWEGKKETILLAHGWESNSFRWKKLIKILHKKEYNIIALDAPAHGKSGSKIFDAVLYADFINSVVNYYKPQIIIGHSVGGMASVYFQYIHQNKTLKKLIILGAPSEFKNILKKYVTMLGYNKRIEKGLNQIALNRFGHEPSSFSLAAFVKNITTKGLIIHDTQDAIILFQEAELISKNYKNSELIVTNDLGHGLKDKSINDKIVSFINQKDS